MLRFLKNEIDVETGIYTYYPIFTDQFGHALMINRKSLKLIEMTKE